MKSLTTKQLQKIKTDVLIYLQSVNFSNAWIEQLKQSFREDNDLATNAFELANYISWNMRHYKIHADNPDFANQCAFQAVTYSMNELLAFENETIEFPAKPFEDWTVKDFEQALKAHQKRNS